MNTDKPVIWDPFIRIFHWSTAAAFLLNYFLLEAGETPHRWTGYYILIMLGIRFIWGFTGPESARFRDFFPFPGRVKEHLLCLKQGHIPVDHGHNPVGGAMVLALMICLAALGVTGWMMGLDYFWDAFWIHDVHELLANTIFLLVLVHVSAVLFFSWKGPVNLVHQMLSGRQCLRKQEDPERNTTAD